MILNNLGKTGIDVRKIYQRRLPSDNSRDYYFILRDTANMQSIIIEYGFIDNNTDLNFIKSNYKKMVDAVVEAVVSYYNIEINNNIYIVKKGDTLYSISKKYGITVNDLKDKNNLSSNMLSIGQKLIIPYDLENIYTVKKGDTLYSISKKYNISVDDLKKINNLSNDILNIGQILIVKK